LYTTGAERRRCPGLSRPNQLEKLLFAPSSRRPNSIRIIKVESETLSIYTFPPPPPPVVPLIIPPVRMTFFEYRSCAFSRFSLFLEPPVQLIRWKISFNSRTPAPGQRPFAAIPALLFPRKICSAISFLACRRVCLSELPPSIHGVLCFSNPPFHPGVGSSSPGVACFRAPNLFFVLFPPECSVSFPRRRVAGSVCGDRIL